MECMGWGETFDSWGATVNEEEQKNFLDLSSI